MDYEAILKQARKQAKTSVERKRLDGLIEYIADLEAENEALASENIRLQDVLEDDELVDWEDAKEEMDNE